MRKLTVDDIVDHRAYERERETFRASIIDMKKRRRIALGDLLTIVFENTDTMRFQVQEMARAERMLTDDAIAGKVTLLRGDGLGTFTRTGSFVTVDEPSALAVADVDRDGFDDVIVTSAAQAILTGVDASKLWDPVFLLSQLTSSTPAPGHDAPLIASAGARALVAVISAPLVGWAISGGDV